LLLPSDDRLEVFHYPTKLELITFSIFDILQPCLVKRPSGRDVRSGWRTQCNHKIYFLGKPHWKAMPYISL